MIPRLDYQDSLSPTTLQFLELLARSAFRGDIEKSYASRLAMATDNSVYQVVPQAVLYPRSADDIAVMLKLAQGPEYATLSFFPRGGGTGTNGQSWAAALSSISRHMNQIMEINLEEGWVRAQAGVVKDQLNAYLKPHGYFFSPDLSTSNRATLGGMVNTDASGQGSLVYGKTSDHVLGLKAVLENGDLMATEPVTGPRLADKLALESREGRSIAPSIASVKSAVPTSKPPSQAQPLSDRLRSQAPLSARYRHPGRQPGAVWLGRILVLSPKPGSTSPPSRATAPWSTSSTTASRRPCAMPLYGRGPGAVGGDGGLPGAGSRRHHLALGQRVHSGGAGQGSAGAQHRRVCRYRRG